MKPIDVAREISARTGIKVWVLIALLVSITGNCLLAVGVLTADRTHRETLIPPEVHKSFWTEGDRVSASYLEEMGIFLIRNALDVTPASAESQMRVILKYADPKSYGVLEKQLMANAQRMKEKNVSTYFALTATTPNEPDQSIAIHGVLGTILGDKMVNEEQKTYMVKFANLNGRIIVRELVETTAAKPFEPAASDAAK